MTRGLVLEGGGFRGMYTAGVIDVFMENGIDFDHTIGVSAGAAFGCNIKSKQIGRVIRYNKRFCNDKRYSSLKSLLKTGDLYNKDFAYGVVPKILDPWDEKTFQENPMRFTVVCTDIYTGLPVYHDLDKGQDEDIEWIRASSSIPLVSNPVKIDGYELLDGGVSDSIPIEWMLKHGYEKNVVVLTRDATYQKEPMKFMRFISYRLKKYPKLIEAMKNRYIRYNKTLEKIKELEEQGRIFVIRPSSPIQCAMIEKNSDHLQAIYDVGRKDALDQLDILKQYL